MVLNRKNILKARNKQRFESCSSQASPASARLRFFDMFSGIGGFRLGLEKAGFKGVAYCEKDKYASMLYREFYDTQEETYFNDATTISTAELPNFDILCAGFPCQPFSIAGKRQGFTDNRGSMFFEITRILRDKRPSYFILENVKGLLNHQKGETFKSIIEVLTNLGYRVQWQLLNTKYFGLPQNRERVYIVGSITGKCLGKIFPLTGISSEDIGKIRQHPVSKNKSQGTRIYYTDGLSISTCLTANGGGLGAKTGLYLVDDDKRARTGTASDSSPLSSIRFINKPRFNKYKTSNILQTLKVGGDIPLLRIKNGTKKGYAEAGIGDGINLAYSNSKTRRGRVGKQVSQTLDTHCNMGTIESDFRIRRLTPLECFRLQGFPDEMVAKAQEIGISNSQLYKMVGNAVSVTVVEAIARKLAEVEYDNKS